MLKIYGVARSRAFRTIWMAEELGLPYQLVPIETQDAGGDAALLSVNPNGRIPAIEDEGVRLSESMAINLYLAKKHGGPLAPVSVEEEGRMLQWCFWVVWECEALAFEALRHAMLLPPERRDIVASGRSLAKLQRPLAVIDAHLVDRRYLVADRFTVADLNVAAVLGWLLFAGNSLQAYPDLGRWLAACRERPASRKAMTMMR